MPKRQSYLNMNDKPPGHSNWLRDYKSLRDFHIFEIVNIFRLSITVEGFRTLILFGGVVFVVIGGTVLIFVCSAFQGFAQKIMPELFMPGLLIILYLAVILIFTEIVPTRRLAVAELPHLELFRALDLPMSQITFRYGLMPLLKRLGCFSYVASLFFIIFAENSQTYLLTAGIVFLGVILTASITVFIVIQFATRPPYQLRLGLTGLGLTKFFWPLIFGVVIGAITSLFLNTNASQLTLSSVSHSLSVYQYIFIYIAEFCAIAGFSISSYRRWKQLSYSNLLLSKSVTPPKKHASHTLETLMIVDFLKSKQGSAITTTFAIWVAFTGLLLGANQLLPLRPNQFSLLNMQLQFDQLQGSLSGLTILLSIGILEPILHRIGPTAKLYQFRFAWENGFSILSITIKALSVYSLAGVLVGLFIFIVVFLLFGIAIFDPIFIGFIVSCAAVLAETIARPPTTTNGAKAPDITDGFLTFIFVSPCALVFTTNHEIGLLLLFCYSILTAIGALLCLRLRLLSLQSQSSQWSQDTEKAFPS